MNIKIYDFFKKSNLKKTTKQLSLISNSKPPYQLVNFAVFALLFFAIFTIGSCTNATTDNQKQESAKIAPMPSAEELKNYTEQLDLGELAMKNAEFESALKHYQAAAVSYNSEEIQGKINESIDKCYLVYFDKGMEYFNAGNFLYAKKEFHTARIFKNDSQVNDMVKKCEEHL